MRRNRQVRRSNYNWQLMLIFLFAAANLQYSFWYGDNSVSSLKQKHQLIATEKDANEKLIEVNNVLKAEVIDLRDGSETMEERARRELGLVKSDENFYRIIEADSDPSLQSSQRSENQ